MTSPSRLPAHPANAPGDFYVEDGCCFTCGVPLDEAPEVFEWVREGEKVSQCIVTHQPKTHESINRTLAAMWAGEVQCIRYRGTDPDILRRIVEMGKAGLCDFPPPSEARPLVRSHVSFRTTDVAVPPTARHLADKFAEHLRQIFSSPPYESFDLKPVRGRGIHATVEFSWTHKQYHLVRIQRLTKGKYFAVAKPKYAPTGIGLSRIVDDWLKADTAFADVRWYSAEQWWGGGAFRSTVV